MVNKYLLIPLTLLFFSCFDTEESSKQSFIYDVSDSVVSSLKFETSCELNTKTYDTISFDVDSGDIYTINISLIKDNSLADIEYVYNSSDTSFETSISRRNFLSKKSDKIVLYIRAVLKEQNCRIKVSKLKSLGNKLDGLWYQNKSEHMYGSRSYKDEYELIENSISYFKIHGDSITKYEVDLWYGDVDIDSSTSFLYSSDYFRSEKIRYLFQDSLLTFSYKNIDAKGYTQFKRYDGNFTDINWSSVFDTLSPQSDLVGTWYIARELEEDYHILYNEIDLLYDEYFDSVGDSWLIQRVRLDSLESHHFDSNLPDDGLDTVITHYNPTFDLFKNSKVSANGDSMWIKEFSWYGNRCLYYEQLYIRYSGQIPPKEWKKN